MKYNYSANICYRILSPDDTNHHLTGPEEEGEEVDDEVEGVAVDEAILAGDDIHYDDVVEGVETHKN